MIVIEQGVNCLEDTELCYCCFFSENQESHLFCRMCEKLLTMISDFIACLKVLRMTRLRKCKVFHF